MRPMRGLGGLGGGGLESTAAKLALALVVGSVLYAMTHNEALVLVPGQVVHGFRVWQPFTYGFVETSPMGVIFGALITYSIGGSLEMSYGPRRMLALVIGSTVLAGILTVVLAMFVPIAPAYAGGNVMTSVIWVAYGLSFGKGQTNFWGIPVTGYIFAAIGAGFVLLGGVFGSFYNVIPDLIALVVVYAYVEGSSPRSWWRTFRHRRMQKELRDRSKHLRVVEKERRDRDQFLN